MPEYNKLVRGKIPEIIRAGGKEPVTKILSEAEHRLELIKKLGEECGEFLADPSADELADVKQVVTELEQLFPAGEVEQRRVEKATERGTFEDAVFLIEVIDGE